MRLTQGLRAAWLLLLVPLYGAAAADFDLIIRDGRVIDGTGSPWYRADVGVRDGRIAAIGELSAASARRTLDAHGRVVAPGFIDMLAQSELTLLVDPRAPSKIFQGITTLVTGEGESVAPLNEAIIQDRAARYARLKLTPDWRTLKEYFARLERQRIGVNFASFIGATTVREMVLGYADRAPTAAELRAMQALVAEGMQQGAVGVSSALEYPPAPYAGTQELIELARVAGRYGGSYATHMRDEGDREPAALDEALRIGREAGVPVQLWHLKVSGHKNFGHMPEIIARIEAARAAGLDVAADTYAYTAWSNRLSAFTPPWANEGGRERLVARLRDPAQRARMRADMLQSREWDNEWLEIGGPGDVLITEVAHPQLRAYLGKRLSDIAAEWHEDPIDAIFDFLIRDDGASYVAVFGMSEPDVALALQQPWVAFDTDSDATAPEGLLGLDHPHPRAYGTYPRILAKYVRAEGRLTLPEAIRKFSALPAARLRLADRGVIKEHMWADIVVFDPDTIHDLATYDDPNRLAVGMAYVLVNGVPVIEDGHVSGALPGKVLRGAGYRVTEPRTPRHGARGSTGAEPGGT